jgi:Zn-dependent peptidase ImmA (M78 family)/DNA-binding XRE family transcriptional regulator
MTDAPENRPFDETFGVRLRAARKMAGLSLENLAAKIGGVVTKQAISKYEKGQMMPSPEVLERLVEVLGKATWGASPLKKADVEFAQPMLLNEVSLCRMESGMEAARFRRKRLFERLLRRPPQPSDESSELRAFDAHSEETFYRRLSSMDFASLADRRALYAAAWDAGAGPEGIRFREGEKLPARSASMLKYRIADHLQKYLGLEALLGMTAAFENPVAGPPPATPEEAEAAAEEVRRRWDLGSGPLVNLLGLIEERGVRVYETTGIEGFEGLSGSFGADPVVPFVAVSRDFPADRIRFTAAHELAHVLCGFPEKEGAESLCHRFAAAFLLPKAAAEKAFGGAPRRKVTLAELGEIKAAYGISLQAVMYRAKALGLVTDRQFRAFRETLNARGWTVTEPVEYAGAERAGRLRRLVHRAVASDILDLERAAEIAGVPAAQLEEEIGEIF